MSHTLTKPLTHPRTHSRAHTQTHTPAHPRPTRTITPLTQVLDFRDAFISREDVRAIAEAGMNVLRVPFGW